jgi:hypothetical protein
MAQPEKFVEESPQEHPTQRETDPGEQIAGGGAQLHLGGAGGGVHDGGAVPRKCRLTNSRFLHGQRCCALDTDGAGVFTR